MITYVDRVCISAGKDAIAGEMHLSDTSMGMIFSAFALGYAVAQIPCGWLADRLGPRLVLAGVVSLWSAMTALTGASWNLVSLVSIRFLFGISEAGAFPGSARAICNWLPAGERGRANGILFSGSRLGGAISFPLLAWMLARWQWRVAFRILGGLGLSWACFWLLWFRDRPASPHHREETNPKAAAGADDDLPYHARPIPIFLAMLQYFASNFTFFIGLSWMLPYLKSQFQLSTSDAAVFAMAPLLAGTCSQWIAGWMVDALYRSRFRALSRRIPAMLGFTLSLIGLVTLTHAATPGSATACFTLAVFGSDMTVSPSWVFCADIAGKSAGSVSGAMNMIGNVGSFASANAFPVLEAATGGAAAYFWAAAALNVIGIGCWLKMGFPARGVSLPGIQAGCPVEEA
jgi:ACS family glucarate transporter-like MFS transporter